MWHGFATRDSDRRGSVSHQAWPSDALKGYSNILPITLETRPVLYSGWWSKTSQVVFLGALSFITRERCSTKDRSGSRNVCRACEEPLKPCQEIFFQQLTALFGEDKLIQSFSQHHRATKHAHVEGEHYAHCGKVANNPFSRPRHETAIDHQDINRWSNLALANIFCQELESLASSRVELSKKTV